MVYSQKVSDIFFSFSSKEGKLDNTN